MSTEGWAAAIRRRGLLLFHPYSQQKPGALIAAPPWTVLSAAASPEEIAIAAKEALKRSKLEIEVVDPNALLDGRYRSVGVRSEDEFMSDAEYLGLRKAGGLLVVTPTENGLHLWHKNFRHLTDQEFHIAENASERTIGESIQHAWDQCC